MSNHKSLNQSQLEADEIHHMKRIEWLKSESPKWSCGTPVSKADVNQMIRSSINCLDLIVRGISLNHANGTAKVANQSEDKPM